MKTTLECTERLRENVAIRIVEMAEKKKLSEEMISDLLEVSSPGEARAFHKKYRRYGREYGLPLYDRYPHLNLWLLGVTWLLSVVAIVISSIALL